MKKLREVFAVLMAALLICGVFVSCGKNSKVAEIKKSGKLVVLTSTGFPPFEYTSNERHCGRGYGYLPGHRR